MSFIYILIHYIGWVIIDTYIVCNSLYICKILIGKLVEIFVTRKLSLIEEHHCPGAPLFSLCHIFPLFLFETYYQRLRLIHYHIHSKEGGIKGQPHSS